MPWRLRGKKDTSVTLRVAGVCSPIVLRARGRRCRARNRRPLGRRGRRRKRHRNGEKTSGGAAMPRYSPGTGLCERLVPERRGGVTLGAPRLGGRLGHAASAGAAGPVSRQSARSGAEGAEGNAAPGSSSGGRQPWYLPALPRDGETAAAPRPREARGSVWFYSVEFYLILGSNF